MRSILKHIRRWNIWKKRCANSWIHKILVLFGLRESITFKMTLLPEEKSLICKGFEDGINQVKKCDYITSAMLGGLNGDQCPWRKV